MRAQMRVQAVAKTARRKMLFDVAMRDLRQRMHAGVGAARAVNANMLAADRLDRVFHRTLHRGAIVLDLPAAERRAVIFDNEFVTGHIDPVRPSSSAKADDPVFRSVAVRSQGCGVLDTPPSRGMTIIRNARPPSAACRAENPPPSLAPCRRAAVRGSAMRLPCRQP